MSFVQTRHFLCTKASAYLVQSLRRLSLTQWLRWHFTAATNSTVHDDNSPSISTPADHLDTFDTLDKLYRGAEHLSDHEAYGLKRRDEYTSRLGFIHQLSSPSEIHLDTRLQELRDQIQRQLRDIKEELTVVIFRHRFRVAHDKREIRRLIRHHLDRCTTVKDIHRVIAVAVQRRRTRVQIAESAHGLARALYRARDYASDRRITHAMIGIVAYLKMKHLTLAPELLSVGVRFAARSRRVPLMTWFLREIQAAGEGMRAKLFRAIIAKCSVGRRGFGEVRNGRWRRSDLLAVLLGPLHDESKGEEPFHLEVFLDRNDWQFLHGWIVILARCRAVDVVWREWVIWRDSDRRKRGEWLTSVKYDYEKRFSFRSRGDNWFVRHLLIAGSPELAWKCLEQSGLGFFGLTRQVRSVLLEHLEFKTEWNADMERELLKKYEEDLEAIESRLGIIWVKIGGAQGYHRPEPDIHEKLEQLARPSYFKVHGFFTDDADERMDDQTVRKYQLIT